MKDLLGKAPRLALAPDTIRALRSVAVLEQIGTRKARGLLQELARGQEGATLTEEAKVSLKRLAGKQLKEKWTEANSALGSAIGFTLPRTH